MEPWEPPLDPPLVTLYTVTHIYVRIYMVTTL